MYRKADLLSGIGSHDTEVEKFQIPRVRQQLETPGELPLVVPAQLQRPESHENPWCQFEGRSLSLKAGD